MAISSGVNPHRAWLSVNGFLIPVLHGHAEQRGTRQSSTFSATVPLNYPGAAGALASIGDNSGGVIVESNGMSAPLVMGEIDTTDFNYGHNGTIIVSGRDNSIKLHNRKANQKFVNQPTTAVVAQLAGMAGLGFAGGGGGNMAGKKLDQEFAKMADGQSFASIITKCAELDGARWFVDNNSVLHYEINPTGGGYSVHYNPGPPESADFLTLSIKRNVQAGKTIKVTVKSWHPKKKQVMTGTGTASGNGGPVEYGYNIPGLQQDQAQQHAKSKANEVARHEITVTAKCVGDPSISVESGLSVSGTGAFDQSYIIDKIHHTFGMGGHTMVITARSGNRSAS